MQKLWILALGLAACRAEPSPPPPRPADPAPLVEAAAPIHGTLEEVAGQSVLRVWGTPRQMGRAQGVLLRGAILDVLEGYALDVITPSQLEAAATVYGTVADIPPSLRAEAEGIVEGMQEAGGAFVPRLDREITAVDLLVMGAMTDLVAIGCSSVSAWGRSIAASSDGEPVVVRNLDWSEEPALLRNQLVVVYQPEDPGRQPVVSVSFAGYLGCLSCINEAGLTALFNMGYGEGAATIAEAASGFSPANLLLRDVLERREVAGADALEGRLEAATHAGSYIVHVIDPQADPPARVLEVEADGVHVRRPGLAGSDSMLAATNHLRGKDGPQSCRRYDAIARRSKARGHRWDLEGLWALAREVRLPQVVHTVMIQPGAGTLRIWFRGPDEGTGSTAAGVEHSWDALVRVPSSP